MEGESETNIVFTGILRQSQLGESNNSNLLGEESHDRVLTQAKGLVPSVFIPVSRLLKGAGS